MTRDQAERLTELLDRLARAERLMTALAAEARQEFRSFLDETTAPASMISTAIINGAPNDAAELPAYFSSCTPEQIRTSFVGLVTDLFFDQFGQFVGSRALLNATLLAVREGSGANIIVSAPRKRREPDSAAHELALKSRCLSQAPNVGDTIAVRTIALRQEDFQLISRLSKTWPEFERYREPYSRTGPGLLMLRRVQ